MTEEAQEGPKWLKELEEKREKRLKARLGHEAGAGSPCLTCADKCPGLDLHFWRKICKNCKCGKENHDVADDDIYCWAQFQLLGSKPNKNKKIVLPGRKDAVELEWMPKGHSDVVESYLKELPLSLLPIKGSPAAQERKQLLQKQIPLHDIDPTLCHALSEGEVQQLNDYVDHVKRNSVGVGHIVKLNELLRSRTTVGTKLPFQMPLLENLILQGADKASPLDAVAQPDRLDLKTLRDLSLDERKALTINETEAAPDTFKIRDLHRQQNHAPLRPILNQVDYQNAINSQTKDLRYPHGRLELPNPHASNRNDYQNPTEVTYPTVTYLDNQNQSAFRPIQPNPGVKNWNEYPTPSEDLNNEEGLYPYGSELHNPKPQHPLVNRYPSEGGLNRNDYQNPTDVNYPGVIGQEYRLSNRPAGRCDLNALEANDPNQGVVNWNDYQNPANVSYPATCGQVYDPKSPNQNWEGLEYNATQHPDYHWIDRDAATDSPGNTPRHDTYPDVNVNFAPGYERSTNLRSEPRLPHYLPSKFATFAEQRRPQKFGDIKDLAYSTYRRPLDDPGEQAAARAPDADTVPADASLPGSVRPGAAAVSRRPRGDLLPDPAQVGADGALPADRGHAAHAQDLPAAADRCADPLRVHDQERRRHAGDPGRPLRFPPALKGSLPSQYPSAARVAEENLLPTAVNIGAITDLEYPIKSAEVKHNQNDDPPPQQVVFESGPAAALLPSCHRCKKTFDATALVIGVERTDALWHADCFRCAGCNQALADLMYFYDRDGDDVFCGRDYAKIRGIPRCRACDELVFVKEYCLAENAAFHVKHFCCFECDEPLAGRNYVMEESQPLCLPCFERLKAARCNACGDVIKPDEQGANLNGVHFHADDACLACRTCGKPLLGAKLLFKNCNLYCSAPCFAADSN